MGTGHFGHHRGLGRQLRRLGLDPASSPDLPGWSSFLEAVSRTYDEADSDRYLMERSIEVSSAEMRTLNDELSRQARGDALTGLLNRSALLEVLAERLATAGARFTPILLFIDLDGFKGVNDTWGHAVGDEMLVRTAERIRSCTRPEDVVARLGGDEFVVLFTGSRSLADVVSVGERVVGRLCEPFQIIDQDLRIGASIGVAQAKNGELAVEVLQHADIAMYDAKIQGKGTVRVFDDELRQRTLDRHRVEADLRLAVDRDEFLLHYQPLVRLADGKVRGVEALLRWNHPRHGLLAPSLFIPVAEETRLINTISSWVVNRACVDVVNWPSGLSVSINLSARDIALDDFADHVAAALGHSGVSARQLVLELTESSLLASRPEVADTLAQLRAMGIRLAIDDFGTGYSSLSYLSRLDVQEVKIDQSFVAGVDSDGTDSAITQAVVHMCHALGLSVVAEGVERLSQVKALKELGCEVAQGFLFARPMTATDLTAYLRGTPIASDSRIDDLPRPRASTSVSDHVIPRGMRA